MDQTTMKFIHYALYAAPILLGIGHTFWPQYDSAIGGILTVAIVIAINTHKPGAAAIIEQLKADAEKVQK